MAGDFSCLPLSRSLIMKGPKVLLVLVAVGFMVENGLVRQDAHDVTEVPQIPKNVLRIVRNFKFYFRNQITTFDVMNKLSVVLLDELSLQNSRFLKRCLD